MQLRQLVGQRPLLMVGAAVLVNDQDDRLLLMKRADSGCWGPPGGSTEPGERVEEAAAREVLEETGLKIEKMDLFGVFSGPELYYRYPNGDEVYNVTIVYTAQVTLDGSDGNNVHLNDEHTEWGWFHANQIPDDISPPMIPTIKQYKQNHH